MNIAQTERLILREFKLTDAQSLCNLNNDPEVIKFTGDAPFVDENEAKAFIQDYSDYGFGRWADKMINFKAK